MNTVKAADVKAVINPEQFYSTRQQGIKSGAGWVDGGLCPFHDDQTSGSFKLNLSTGAFKCFSCGANGGDIIDFAMLQDHASFPSTIKTLAAEYGVSGTELTDTQREAIRDRNRLSMEAERMEVLQHELHVFLQVIALRVSDNKNKTNMKFREARPEWRPMPLEHWQREIEAAGNIVGMIRLCYPEVN